MLLCIVCGKVIANTDPEHTRYGGCAACPIDEVNKGMEELDMRHRVSEKIRGMLDGLQKNNANNCK